MVGQDEDAIRLLKNVYYQVLDENNILRHSRVEEIDRLGRCVDLIEYSDSGFTRKAVFKYQLVPHHVNKIWTEAHIVYGLREHESIVSFDKFVVDDAEGRLLGYTSVYAPGQTLRDNPNRPFCLSWLDQLTHIVDDLNLKYRILHQGHCSL